MIWRKLTPRKRTWKLPRNVLFQGFEIAKACTDAVLDCFRSRPGMLRMPNLKPGLKHPRLLRKRLLESTLGSARLELALNELHGRRSSWCARPQRLRRFEWPQPGHVRSQNHEASPARAAPVDEGVVETAPPVLLVEVRVRPKMVFVAQDKVQVRVLERIVHTARCEIMTGNGFALPLAEADHLDVLRSEVSEKIRVRAFPYGNVCRVEASLPPCCRDPLCRAIKRHVSRTGRLDDLRKADHRLV